MKSTFHCLHLRPCTLLGQMAMARYGPALGVCVLLISALNWLFVVSALVELDVAEHEKRLNEGKHTQIHLAAKLEQIFASFVWIIYCAQLLRHTFR